MRILGINSWYNGSTGNIMQMCASETRKRGHEVVMCCPFTLTNKNLKKDNTQWLFGQIILRKLSEKLAYLTSKNGCFNRIDTWLLLRRIKKWRPDVIHLHNLHPDYINLPLLFSFIKKNNIPVVWTLHDCWAFTGGCAHFEKGCSKWKEQCYGCKLYRVYPASMFDNSRRKYIQKKQWFTGVDNMVLCTPSKWLANLCEQSFMSDYPIRAINNGIDLNIFWPHKSNIRERFSIKRRWMVLAVASGWTEMKGVDVVCRIAEMLSDDYQVVMVGAINKVENYIPKNVITIQRTEDQCMLSDIYSAADVFINPTRQEVLSMVNIEAIACGTPVVTFRAGGAPETIDDTCGVVVEQEDVAAMKNEIIRICGQHPYSVEACCKRAQIFDKHRVYNKYVDVYEMIVQ